MRTHTHLHTQTRANTCRRAHAHTLAHAQTHKLTDTRTHTHTYKHPNTQAHTYAQTHTHMHAYACTCCACDGLRQFFSVASDTPTLVLGKLGCIEIRKQEGSRRHKQR